MLKVIQDVNKVKNTRALSNSEDGFETLRQAQFDSNSPQ